MPAQKRPLPPPTPPPDHQLPPSDESPPADPPPPPSSLPTPAAQHEQEQGREEDGGDGGEGDAEKEPPEVPQEQDADSDGRNAGGQSSDEEDEDDDEAVKLEFVPVKLADIRKEVQCPICLGIIRKTRTVMECLHRFCRECIDKSMRLGNNECPACRTHCASRRSLRDDPNYDALIAALYPDIDKYEEEELAFHEEDKFRNKKIQAYIAETFRRQSEALGRRRSTSKAATPFGRRSQGSYRNHLRGRGRNIGRDMAVAGSDDDEEEEANGNDGTKDSSSADEPSPDRRPKRCKRWGAPRSSPARTVGSVDVGSEENDDFEVNKEPLGTSPLRAGNRDMLAWGKNGTRSQTRHGNTSGANGRLVKGGRMAKLVDYLRSLDDADDEFDVHLTLVPLDDGSMPNLEQPYLSCRPTLSIGHLCQFIALQTSVQAEELEIYARKPRSGTLGGGSSSSMDDAPTVPCIGLQILEGHESLATLIASFTSERGELVLVYRRKAQYSAREVLNIT
ncbi:putative E3 ubiquitin-protein ligase RING1a isoform X2 [Musa acuminata AAA Group]|uniref:putative E3 ubiquitin-protein ligase RING1a isoform X2 n=1 Tax=Musa acuminata AAA Group TaxID=214697 RepID=UPI0031E2ADE8